MRLGLIARLGLLFTPSALVQVPLMAAQSGTERTERTGPAGLKVRRDASLNGWFLWLLGKCKRFRASLPAS